jgi:biopolymer transport protein ExbD
VKQQYHNEHSVTVSADPEVQYEYVVAAMDAVRNRGKEPLFPEVMISVGVR